eukprot:11089761-Alexandrium_andersonii.AAC.1
MVVTKGMCEGDSPVPLPCGESSEVLSIEDGSVEVEGGQPEEAEPSGQPSTKATMTSNKRRPVLLRHDTTDSEACTWLCKKSRPTTDDDGSSGDEGGGGDEAQQEEEEEKQEAEEKEEVESDEKDEGGPALSG